MKSPPVLWIWRPLRHAPDEELIRKLSALNGIGVWTAEMLMIFSLCRPDVLSWGDLGIRRGMALLYGDRELTRERFERRRKLLSPYGVGRFAVLWSIAGHGGSLGGKAPQRLMRCALRRTGTGLAWGTCLELFRVSSPRPVV